MQNSTQNQLIRAIIEKKIKEDLQKQQFQNSGNPLDRINELSSKVGSFGDGLSQTGKFLNNNFSSFDKIGSGMQTVGNGLQTGANAVQNTVPTSSGLIDKIGSKITSALPSAIGGTATSAGVGTAAGTTAATGATTAGASAAGASAGGSAASGAMAGGPIGALAALGMMALQGTNRKRAKQMNAQAQQLSESQVDLSQNRLAQTAQVAEQLGNSPLSSATNDDYLTKFGGDTQTLIDNYIQSSMPEESIISNAINSYVNQPEVYNAVFENDTKNKVFGNLANGLNDFISGYNENKSEGFKPENIKYDSSKGAMQRIGEGFGTVSRMVKNPVIQGLVAGGLSGALTGNPLYGLGMAYKFTNNMKNSDLYRDILSQQGINTDISNGTISADDMVKVLATKKLQKDYMTRKEYDLLRLENGQISIEDYNNNLVNPDYNPDEMVNIGGIKTVSKAGRMIQENKNDRSKNYYRNKNDGKNVIRVEYDEKPDTHNYTHVIYDNKKPEQITRIIKEDKTTPTAKTKPISKPKQQPVTKPKAELSKNQTRVKVKSPDGKVGSIPAFQLLDAIKQGFKKL